MKTLSVRGASLETIKTCVRSGELSAASLRVGLKLNPLRTEVYAFTAKKNPLSAYKGKKKRKSLNYISS